ncbi:hypothetical protein X975_21318, partial [Stegodyphus mimosarum]
MNHCLTSCVHGNFYYVSFVLTSCAYVCNYGTHPQNYINLNT